MSTPVCTVRKGSFIRLVYSFHHDAVPAKDVVSRVGSGASQFSWTDRTIITSFVLPHLAEHINVSPGSDRREVAHWWELDRRPDEQVLGTWTLHVGSRQLELAVSNVELVVFATHIGVVIIDVCPVSDRAVDWLEVLHRARFYGLPRRSSAPMVERETEGRANTFARRAARIVPAAPHSRFATDSTLGFGLLIDELVTDALGSHSWTRASVPGRMFAYSAVSIDTHGAGDDATHKIEYRWRRMLQPNARVASTAEAESTSTVVPYADRMHFAMSMDGGGFFAADAGDDHFFSTELLHHVHRPYFFGFLLAAHQRLALARYSEEVANAWVSDRPQAEALERIQDDFLFYLSACSFVQVMQTANHHAHHRRWLEVLEVDLFQREVESELRRLYERVTIRDQIEAGEQRRREEARTKVLERRVAGLGLAFALPSVALAALGVIYPQGVTPWIVWVIAAGLLGAGIAFAFVDPDRHRPRGTADGP